LRIGIIGCGIAGQAAAIALARDGHDVTVFERFAEAKPVGAGLLLQPSGQRVLERLGILDRAKRWGAPVHRLHGRTTGGRTFMDLRYAKFDKQAQGLGLHRAALFQALHDGLAETGAKIVLGFDVLKIKDFNAPRLIARDGRQQGPFDLVVDCAGAHDNLRKVLNVPLQDPVYPWGCLWAILPDRTDEFQNELRQVCESTQIMIGILPIGRVPGAAFDGNHVALFWSLLHKKYGAQRNMGIDALRARIQHYWPESKPIVEQLQDINQFSLATYRDVRMKTWREGRVLVIGDAAHGTSPQLGQGANLALIDAISLASALRRHHDVESALIAYEKMRQPHLRYYQWASRRVTPLFQSNSRVMGWMRDIFFGPMAKTPGVARIMRNTLAGVRKSPFGLWKIPD
jgi:2-polyprenyl-6-methoxyphenol hydroxylase-like FAD-dependent oxidoreductase